ncbi:MAG: hypothetical protein QXK06_02810 [Candidatus Diapherotrites archaeon]
MEQSTFKLAVYGILAAALLYLFLFHFGPNYLWKENPIEVVKKNLDRAEEQLGVYSTQEGTFKAGHTVHATGFESPDRAVVFNCNNSLFCCEQGKDCSKTIEWDNTGTRRYFSFNQEKTVPFSARCRYENLYICKVYLGSEPAQIQINQLELSTKELNLAETSKLKIPFEVENTGKKDIVSMQVKAKVFRKLERSDGTVEKKFVKEFSTEFPLETGEKKSGELEIEISENGKYEAEITAVEKTDETNYRTKTLEFNAFGKVETRECIEENLPVQEKQKCVYLLPCKCKSILACENHWRKRLELGLEEKIEVESRNDETQEIVLRYETNTIPAWCDTKTMNCEGECQPLPTPVKTPTPETKCTLQPCASDLQNCRIWLPCECEQGASIQKCIDAWTASVGPKNFQQGTYNGKTALYVQGTMKSIPVEICDRCGGTILTQQNCCELPTVGNCSGTNCITTTQTPAQPKPNCQGVQPQITNCVLITTPNSCMAVLPCICMDFTTCKQAWEQQIISKWGIPAPAMIQTTYNGEIVPAIPGEYVGQCDHCGTVVNGCKFQQGDGRYIDGSVFRTNCYSQ